MDSNIQQSSTVSMVKKPPKQGGEDVEWESVVKLRKSIRSQCSEYPKNCLGIRNSWVKKLSNMLSEKVSEFVVRTLSADRTARQQEIAQTLLNRANSFLEQEATLDEPKTATDKAMVAIADRLSLWLDETVPVSKNVGARLEIISAEEKTKRLVEELRRMSEERERMSEMQMADGKLARDVQQPPSDDAELEDHDVKIELGMGTGDDEHEENGSEIRRELVDDDQNVVDRDVLQPSSNNAENEDHEVKIRLGLSGKGKHEENDSGIERELEDDEQNVGDRLQQRTESIGGAIGSSENADVEEEVINFAETDQQVLSVDQPKSENGVARFELAESPEPDIPDDSPFLKYLDFRGTDVDRSANTLDSTYQTTSGKPESPQASSAPTLLNSEVSSGGEIDAEASDDTGTLVEMLGSSINQEAEPIDYEDVIEIVKDHGSAVLHEVAETIAATLEAHSPLQEAIEDILEERHGDEAINDVAEIEGTSMDKMVEVAGEENGENALFWIRSPSATRSESPRSVPESTRELHHRSDEASLSGPTFAVPPDNLPADTSLTAWDNSPPVSRKPKGPIFQLRKVDAKNIFNVASISRAKASRKIRQVRGRHVSQESLDIEEWAEWAGLVSDVSRNWAHWVDGVAWAVEWPVHKLSNDAKEWQNVNRKLLREGNVWMDKIMRKQRKTIVTTRA